MRFQTRQPLGFDVVKNIKQPRTTDCTNKFFTTKHN